MESHPPASSSRLDSGKWPLRPGDLPPARAARDPRLAGMRDNAVFRLLAFQHHRQGRGRRLLLAGFAAGMAVLGGGYAQRVFGVSWPVAFAASTALAAVVTIGLGMIFLHAGIEGYESNGNLRPFFFDLAATGIGADEIARGIWGATASRYPIGLMRAALIGSAMMLGYLSLFLSIEGADPILLWVIGLGVLCAGHLSALTWLLHYIPLAGTAMWYRGIRHAYERRMAAIENPNLRDPGAPFRLFFFLGASLGLVFVPVFLYMALGFIVLGLSDAAWPLTEPARVIGSATAILFAAGAFSGTVLGLRARRKSPARFAALTEDVRRLFELRGELPVARPRSTSHWPP